jgi:hypothetical protein
VDYVASYSPLEPRRFAQKSLIAQTSLAILFGTPVAEQ